MPKFDGATSYPYPMSVVFNAVVQAAQNLKGWVVKEVDQPHWYIVASVSFNYWSYGEDIGIQVTESPPGQSWVSVSSASKFAIIDFGKNRKNVDRLLAGVHDVLAQAGYSAVHQEQEQQQQAPVASPGQAPATVQCRDCGARQRSEARFCNVCGKEMVPPQSPGPDVEQPPAAAECTACGMRHAPDAKFCMGCGQALRPPASSG